MRRHRWLRCGGRLVRRDDRLWREWREQKASILKFPITPFSRSFGINLAVRGVQEIVNIHRASMRLLLIVAIYCVPLFAHPPGSPTDSSEAAIYKSFVKQHTTWAGGCESAVLDSDALPIAEGFQQYAFSRERVKPPKELVALLSQSTSSSSFMPLQATGEPFFMVVDHAILENLFSEEKCQMGDMQQHKCGWLKFKDDFGNACGYWQFSHVTFNAGQTQALVRYSLSILRWGEGGWVYFRREKGQWRVASVSVSYTT